MEERHEQPIAAAQIIVGRVKWGDVEGLAEMWVTWVAWVLPGTFLGGRCRGD